MMRSRIAMAAVAASLVAGLGACSSTSNAAQGGASGASPSASPSTTVATTAASSASPSVSATSSTSAAAADFTSGQLETMRAKVAAVFGQGVTSSSSSSTVDSTELAGDFDSQATITAVWGTGAVGSDRPMDCGMAKYDGVAIGAVQASGDVATVPVVLYYGAKAGTATISVSVDPTSGVIKGTTCGGAPDPAALPGIAPIAAYYGATVTMDQSVINDKTEPYFTPTLAAWTDPGANYNQPTCSQDVPDRWIVALTNTTSTSSAWDFSPVPVLTVVTPETRQEETAVGFTSSLAVDLGSNKISRVTCGRAYPPKADSAHPADYVPALMDYYRMAASQKTLGVDPKAAIESFFVSDAAFKKAWDNTGAVPLLCATAVPGSVEVTEGTTPTTAGGKTTVKMVTWADWHPDAPGQEASKFTIVLDTSTMKISSITCTK